MKLYSKKQRWKKILLLAGILIIGIIFWLTSILVSNVKVSELEKIRFWSEAVKKKAELVRLTNIAFQELSQNETNNVYLWARATKEFQKSLNDFGLALEIIQKNNNIPLILTDNNGIYISHKNIDLLDISDSKKRQGKSDSITLKWASQNKPIEFNYYKNRVQRIFYSNSSKYFQLQSQRDSLINSFSKEIMNNIAQLPVVFWSQSGDSLIASNVINKKMKRLEMDLIIQKMSENNNPVEIYLGNNDNGVIYYSNSKILFQLQYFPLLTLLIVALFLLVSYLSFSSFRRSEQNQVWAGMAKETAHQLGTPLSSLYGWITLLKESGQENSEAFIEMEKDIERLTVVSERFSKIGSSVEIIETDLVEFFNNYISYMKKRIPKTVELNMEFLNQPLHALINAPLFSWVIENVIKNAADAMEGNGNIFLNIEKQQNSIVIKVKDNGKGIPSSIQKTIFQPGYTTKDRGWGLGLSLAKRIVEGHHNGKIYISSSKKGIGTVVEITLPSSK